MVAIHVQEMSLLKRNTVCLSRGWDCSPGCEGVRSDALSVPSCSKQWLLPILLMLLWLLSSTEKCHGSPLPGMKKKTRLRALDPSD